MPSENVVWAPQPGPQHAYLECPCQIVFLGGARGGGKTDAVLGKWAIKESMYGRHFNAIMFRRSTVSAEDAIERSKEIYKPLGGKFSESKLIWKMPNGGRVAFKYLETVKDADEYQGRNVSDAWVEEAGQYALPDPIDRLHGVLRSRAGVPTQLTLTANPGGAGQHWIRERFKLHPFPRKPCLVPLEIKDPLTEQVTVIDMAVIPSRLTDNKILMDNDPTYSARLALSGGEKLVRAWLLGDWSAIEGAFFDEWDSNKHVLEPFRIPDGWMRFGAFDWGSSKPFSMGWYAVVPDDFKVNGVELPAGALVKYREWYGAKGPDKGLKLTVEQIAEGDPKLDILGIKQREGDEYINYRVADPAIFAEDGGPSMADRFADCGVAFYPADNKRVPRKGHVGGWDMTRNRLRGENGRPMLYFFRTCVDSIRTIPVLQHDERNAEDLDTTMEDHAADELRYACMSRPWVPGEGAEIVIPGHDYWQRRKQESTWKTA